MASMAIGKAGYQNTPPQVCAAGRFRPAEQDWRIGCMSPDPPLCFKGCWGKALGANAKI